MPFWLNCRNFNVNEINGLKGENLRASSRFTQKTGKIGVSTQSGSNCDLRHSSAPCPECGGEPTFSPEGRLSGGEQTYFRQVLNFAFVPKDDQAEVRRVSPERPLTGA